MSKRYITSIQNKAIHQKDKDAHLVVLLLHHESLKDVTISDVRPFRIAP